jgi:hypothetical protein
MKPFIVMKSIIVFLLDVALKVREVVMKQMTHHIVSYRDVVQPSVKKYLSVVK